MAPGAPGFYPAPFLFSARVLFRPFTPACGNGAIPVPNRVFRVPAWHEAVSFGYEVVTFSWAPRLEEVQVPARFRPD